MEQVKLTITSNAVKSRAAYFLQMVPTDGTYQVIIRPADTRSLDQNAKLWPMLQDICKQVDWYGYNLTREEWKDFFMAILKEQKVVPNPDRTGFIAVGGHTSKLSRKKFSDLIELIYAFGAEHDVEWSDRAARAYETYKEVA